MATEQKEVNTIKEYWYPHFATNNAIDVKHVPHQGFRAYRSSPNVVSFQVRTATAKQGRVATCGLTYYECRQLINFLEEAINEDGKD